MSAVKRRRAGAKRRAGGAGATRRAARTQAKAPRGARGHAALGAHAGAAEIGITCYSHFGGSGVVATELGLGLARRGWDVHFIAHRLPFRLRRFESSIFFHEVTPVTYPVFEQPPNNLALATKMVEVVENHGLDLLHVHYAMPFAASAYLARQLVLPRQLGVVTTLHGTDITRARRRSGLLPRHPVQHPVERPGDGREPLPGRQRPEEPRHHQAHRGGLQLRGPGGLRARAAGPGCGWRRPRPGS